MNTSTKILIAVFVLFAIGAIVYLNGFAVMMSRVNFN